MAVRPASRGPSGVVYALLFFVFLALVGLGLAIMFYSQLEEARVATGPTMSPEEPTPRSSGEKVENDVLESE